MSDHDVTPMVLSSITTDDCDEVSKMCNGGSDQCSYTNGGVTDHDITKCKDDCPLCA